MSNEIKFAIMNAFIHPWQERLSCFDCNLHAYFSKSTKFYTNSLQIHKYVGPKLISRCMPRGKRCPYFFGKIDKCDTI